MKADPTSDPIPDTAAPEQISERQSSGWDIRNAPRNYLWLLVFQAASALLSFAAVWLITQQIGKDGFGGIMAVIVASQAALVLVNWTATSVVRYGVDEFVRSAHVAGTFWTRSVILALNFVVVLAAYPLWFPPLSDWARLTPEALVLLLLHFGFTAIWLHVQAGLQAAKMLSTQGFLQMIERLMIVAGVAYLVTGGNLGSRNAVLCYAIPPLIMAAVGFAALRPFVFVRFRFEGAYVRKLIVYSLPLLPFSLVGYFSGSYLDALFVSKFLSTGELGVYSLAIQINGIAMQVPTLANMLLLPLFVTQQAESGERSFRYFRTLLPGLVLGWGLACTAGAFVCSLLVPAVFGAEFVPAVTPLWILLSATVVWVPIAIGYSALANSASSTYISLAAAVASSAVNVAGNFILIPRYGLAGCALATLAAFTAGVVTFALFLRGTARMPLSWTFAAFLPSTASVALLLITGIPLVAFAGAVGLTGALVFWKLTAIRELLAFISGFGRRA